MQSYRKNGDVINKASVQRPNTGQRSRDPSSNPHPNVRFERISPIKTHPTARQIPKKNVSRPSQSSSGQVPPVKDKRKLDIRDFMFGFLVGLVIFGIAAVIVCNALVDMMS